MTDLRPLRVPCILNLSLRELSRSVDVPHSMMRSPMVGTINFETRVVLGTEHRSVLLSVIWWQSLEGQNFGTSLFLCLKIGALLGLLAI